MNTNFWKEQWDEVTDTDELFDSPEPQSSETGGSSGILYRDVFDNWPKTPNKADDKPSTLVFESLFGSKYDMDTYKLDIGGGNKVTLYNACTTRASIAFTLSGKDIPKKYWDFIASQGEIKGKGIITTATKFLTYAKTPSGLGNPTKIIKEPASLEAVRKVIGGKTGLYIMIPKDPAGFGANGHVGLWTGYDVLGGHNYIDSNTREIYFWELK